MNAAEEISVDPVSGVVDHAAIIAAAQARADRDVAQGVADLEAAVDIAPEWERRGRSIVPVKAQLAGMLEHLRESYDAQHREAT